MAQVTIGVPVFNGEKYLADCLDCLRRQTFSDIEILIHDNASTDATGEIARRFCELDSRFHYLRHAQNIGFLPNFRGLLEEARSPYFCWRAHDDVSSQNWIEALVHAFECDRTSILSISQVRLEEPDGTELRTIPAPLTRGRTRTEIAREMLAARCFAWFWCLWRREPLKSIMDFTAPRYANPWGVDMVTLFPVSVTGLATSSSAAIFHSRVNPESVSQTMLKEADLSFQWSYQHAFKHHVRSAFSAIDVRDLPPGIDRKHVKRHIRTIVGRRKFTKNLMKKPQAALTALYRCYTEDFGGGSGSEINPRQAKLRLAS